MWSHTFQLLDDHLNAPFAPEPEWTKGALPSRCNDKTGQRPSGGEDFVTRVLEAG